MIKSLFKKSFFNKEEKAAITAAIGDAERGSRGEVRVHIESACPGENSLDRAQELFLSLGMDKTEEDTGVLLYAAVDNKQAAVYAGSGIYESAEPGFWQEVIDTVTKGFSGGNGSQGIADALAVIGRLLREKVPGEDRAGNELPNEISSS
ncbi:MAG: hypothetical protein GY754_17395 [bacterium]|nr:hypothetical protein [bacterium]